MYILIVFSVLIASINSVLLKKTRLNEKTELFKFNLCTALIWCIVLFITNKGQLYLNASIWMWGMVYGLAQSFFIFFKAAAMNTGAVSVTTLIGNSSLFVSIFASLIIWKEKVTVMDLLFSIIFSICSVCGNYFQRLRKKRQFGTLRGYDAGGCAYHGSILYRCLWAYGRMEF